MDHKNDTFDNEYVTAADRTLAADGSGPLTCFFGDSPAHADALRSASITDRKIQKQPC